MEKEIPQLTNEKLLSCEERRNDLLEKYLAEEIESNPHNVTIIIVDQKEKKGKFILNRFICELLGFPELQRILKEPPETENGYEISDVPTNFFQIFLEWMFWEPWWTLTNNPSKALELAEIAGKLKLPAFQEEICLQLLNYMDEECKLDVNDSLKTYDVIQKFNIATTRMVLAQGKFLNRIAAKFLATPKELVEPQSPNITSIPEVGEHLQNDNTSEILTDDDDPCDNQQELEVLLGDDFQKEDSTEKLKLERDSDKANNIITSPMVKNGINEKGLENNEKLLADEADEEDENDELSYPGKATMFDKFIATLFVLLMLGVSTYIAHKYFHSKEKLAPGSDFISVQDLFEDLPSTGKIFAKEGNVATKNAKPAILSNGKRLEENTSTMRSDVNLNGMGSDFNADQDTFEEDLKSFLKKLERPPGPGENDIQMMQEWAVSQIASAERKVQENVKIQKEIRLRADVRSIFITKNLSSVLLYIDNMTAEQQTVAYNELIQVLKSQFNNQWTVETACHVYRIPELNDVKNFIPPKLQIMFNDEDTALEMLISSRRLFIDGRVKTTAHFSSRNSRLWRFEAVDDTCEYFLMKTGRLVIGIAGGRRIDYGSWNQVRDDARYHWQVSFEHGQYYLFTNRATGLMLDGNDRGEVYPHARNGVANQNWNIVP